MGGELPNPDNSKILSTREGSTGERGAREEPEERGERGEKERQR